MGGGALEADEGQFKNFTQIQRSREQYISSLAANKKMVSSGQNSVFGTTGSYDPTIPLDIDGSKTVPGDGRSNLPPQQPTGPFDIDGTTRKTDNTVVESLAQKAKGPVDLSLGNSANMQSLDGKTNLGQGDSVDRLSQVMETLKGTIDTLSSQIDPAKRGEAENPSLESTIKLDLNGTIQVEGTQDEATQKIVGKMQEELDKQATQIAQILKNANRNGVNLSGPPVVA